MDENKTNKQQSTAVPLRNTLSNNAAVSMSDADIPPPSTIAMEVPKKTCHLQMLTLPYFAGRRKACAYIVDALLDGKVTPQIDKFVDNRP